MIYDIFCLQPRASVTCLPQPRAWHLKQDPISFLMSDICTLFWPWASLGLLVDALALKKIDSVLANREFLSPLPNSSQDNCGTLWTKLARETFRNSNATPATYLDFVCFANAGLFPLTPLLIPQINFFSRNFSKSVSSPCRSVAETLISDVFRVLFWPTASETYNQRSFPRNT